jgi:hypothetical protein
MEIARKRYAREIEMGSETEGGGDGDRRRKMEIKGQRNVQ